MVFIQTYKSPTTPLRSVVAGVHLSSKHQLTRASTDVHRLGVLRNDPVLGSDVPVADITAGDVSVEGSAHTGLDAQTVKGAKLDNGVLRSTESNVALNNFVTSDGAVVGDGGLNSVEDVPQLGVTTGSTTGGDASLG